MSKLNNKELSFARLKTKLFMPDLGEVGPTLTNKNTPEGKAVKMTVDEPYVRIELSNKLNKSVTLVVPMEQFTHLVEVPEAAKLEKNSKA